MATAFHSDRFDIEGGHDSGATVAPPSLAGMRLLVVEDDVDLLEGLVDWLTLEGAVVTKASGGNKAIAEFVRERPDVLLSDLWMPDGSGYDLIKDIRARPPEQGGLVPAIATSAAENVSSAIMAGFHVFVPKPYDWTKLVDTVASFGPHEEGAQSVVPWTITATAPDRITITLVGRVKSGDMRAMTAALVVLLERGPAEIVADLRELGDFTPSVGSIVERTLWKVRRNIAKFHVLGGRLSARLVCAGTCRILGIECSFSDSAPLVPHASRA